MMSSKIGIPWPTGVGLRFAAGAALGAGAGFEDESFLERDEDDPLGGPTATTYSAAPAARFSAAQPDLAKNASSATTTGKRNKRKPVPGRF
jgi:hypothetical protein